MPIVLRLRDLREAAGLTQAELSRLSGVRQAKISTLERGLVQRIDLDILDRLARALRVAPGYLLASTPDA